MTALGTVIRKGLVAARGAASIAGQLFYAFDEKRLYIDNGSTWDAADVHGLVIASGDLLQASASNVLARKAIGASNTHFTSDGTTGVWLPYTNGGGGGTPTFSGAGAYNNADFALSTSGEGVVTMNAEAFDVGAYHSTSSNTGRLTAPSTGYYQWNVNLRLSANVAGYAVVRKNGSAGTILGYCPHIWNSTNSFGEMTGSNITSLTAGDYIEIYATVSGACNAVAPGAGPTPWFSISLLGA